MSHYVYRLTNKNPFDERIYYVGKHSGGLDDFSTGKYRTSSKKISPIFNGNFDVKIVKTFETPEEALMFEGIYHNRLDVMRHEKFYNEQNQSLNGKLDRTGMVSVINLETNEKMTIPVEKFNSHSKYVSLNKNNVLCKDKLTNIKMIVPKEEFKQNDNLVGINYGLIHCKLKSTKEKITITTEEYHTNKHMYEYTQARRISAYDTLNDKKVQIEPEEFDGKRYVGIKTYTKEETKQCELCEHEISLSNFERHVNTHNTRLVYVTDNENINTKKVSEYQFYSNLQNTHYICESGMNVYKDGKIIRKRKSKTGPLKKEKCENCGKEIGGVCNIRKHKEMCLIKN